MTVSAAVAPAPTSPGPEVRYHYGDNPGWANPTLDDSPWPVAPNGAWPLPPLHSDGIVWVHFRVPIPAQPAKDLAMRLIRPRMAAESQQLFLDGALIGQSGTFPPAPKAVDAQDPMFAVAAAVGAHEPFATLALRLWYPPAFRYRGGQDRVTYELGSAAMLKEQQHAERLAVMLSWVPVLSLNALLALVGISLPGLWFWSRRRELLWFALLLVQIPLQQLFLGVVPAFTSHSLTNNLIAQLVVLVNSTGMVIGVEFLWIIFGLRNPWLRIELHSTWVIFNAAFLAAYLSASDAHVVWAWPIVLIALSAFDLEILLIEIQYLVTGPNRAIAAGLAVIAVASLLNFWLHLNPIDVLGIPHLSLFNAGYLLVGGLVPVMLVRRALAASHQGSLLRMEMAAAREVQQNLVPAVLPRIENCQLEAEYMPAQEVGGDFYQVIQQADGSSLMVVGDVSGKGLRAAMAGARAIGTLRAIAAQTSSPSALLRAPNAQICATRDAGFITCVCASFKPDGTLALANAGHLPPYCNGHEVAVEPGLPLGLDPDFTYPETQARLAPGDRLTLLSDGVAEARSASGELFGFDRTAEISTQSAEAIATAAQAFGQEDDITVLTLTFAPTEVLHA